MIARHELVQRYLDGLRREARDLPARQRDELLEEIELHLTEALSDESSEAEVRTELERLGHAGDIVAEERDRAAQPTVRPGAKEYLALLLLLVSGLFLPVVGVVFGVVLVGGLLLPVVGWLAGVVLLWLSQLWSIGDKLVGTLQPVGWLLAVYALRLGLCTGSECTAAGEIAWIVILAPAVLLPVFASVYLGRALRRAERLPRPT